MFCWRAIFGCTSSLYCCEDRRILDTQVSTTYENMPTLWSIQAARQYAPEYDKCYYCVTLLIYEFILFRPEHIPCKCPVQEPRTGSSLRRNSGPTYYIAQDLLTILILRLVVIWNRFGVLSITLFIIQESELMTVIYHTSNPVIYFLS